MTKFQSKYTQCLDVAARNPTALMQETSVTELHLPATKVSNTLRSKKWLTFRTAHLYVSFLRNLFRNFINVLLKFKGYDKKSLHLFRGGGGGLGGGGTGGSITFINLSSAFWRGGGGDWGSITFINLLSAFWRGGGGGTGGL